MFTVIDGVDQPTGSFNGLLNIKITPKNYIICNNRML